MVGPDTDPLVDNLEDQWKYGVIPLVARFDRETHTHAKAGCRELDCVSHNVEQDLADADRIDENIRRQGAARRRFKPQPFLLGPDLKT